MFISELFQEVQTISLFSLMARHNCTNNDYLETLLGGVWIKKKQPTKKISILYRFSSIINMLNPGESRQYPHDRCKGMSTKHYNRHCYCHNHWSVTVFEYFSEWLVHLVYSD